MTKFVERYQKIADKLIKKSFPNLRDKKIRLVEYNFSESYAGFIPVINFIGIHKRCRNFSNKELEALFAHELSHFDILLEMSFFERFGFYLAHVFSKKVQSSFETAADKELVKGGYSRGFYSLIKKNENSKTKIEIERRLKNGYLSSEQIKSYAQKIGKW